MRIVFIFLFLYCGLYSNSALRLCLGKLLERIYMYNTGLWYLFYLC